MTNLYAVVGEHRDEPGRLLLLGDDGQYYDYDALHSYSEPSQVVPTDEWNVDTDALEASAAP